MITVQTGTLATGALLSPLAGGNQSALAAGFVRRDTDAANPFYDIVDAFQQFANTESKALDLAQVGARELDPSKLDLQYDHEINIFFINEGAGYRNQLGVTATGATQLEEMVFEDITCVQDCSHTGYRTPSNVFGTPDGNPLAIGDYYNLGLVKGGSSLDFFLRRDGFGRSETDIWYTDTNLNSDGLQHVIAYEFNNYLVLAWEDISGGGDQDYNDVVFAVDFGKGNLEQLDGMESIPEPGFSMLGFAMVGAVGLSFSRYSREEVS
jgi:hypothetical protein